MAASKSGDCMTEVENTIIASMKENGYNPHDFYVVVNVPRYPQVVLWDNYQGYWWDWETMSLGQQFCTCNAYEASECCCGVWDSEDYGDGKC